MKLFKVVKCPDCKFMMITRASKRVRCRRCGRTFKIIDHTLYQADTWDEARIYFYRGR